jgi:hypothetical protein
MAKRPPFLQHRRSRLPRIQLGTGPLKNTGLKSDGGPPLGLRLVKTQIHLLRVRPGVTMGAEL